MREASHYSREEGGRVRCRLCHFNCLISDGKRGICTVRENRGGTLYTLVYGRICAEGVDPVEKKPLFHFMPGSLTYSIATRGCNFRCGFCQNYMISQLPSDIWPDEPELSPETVVGRAVASQCTSISYTYTEPSIFYEFALDTAKKAAEAGLKNIFVTNGYTGREALDEIAPFLDAANIDLKGFSESFYRDVVHAELGRVLETIIDYKNHGIWIELTTLLIPGMNDSEKELRGIASFMVKNLGADTPWHVTGFRPAYRFWRYDEKEETTLEKAREIGISEGLNYVYTGNIPGGYGEDTFCPGCGNVLIKREGFAMLACRVADGRCPGCGREIAGYRLCH